MSLGRLDSGLRASSMATGSAWSFLPMALKDMFGSHVPAALLVQRRKEGVQVVLLEESLLTAQVEQKTLCRTVEFPCPGTEMTTGYHRQAKQPRSKY